MAASMSAVAAICVPAPAITHGQNAGGIAAGLAGRQHDAGQQDQREGKTE